MKEAIKIVETPIEEEDAGTVAEKASGKVKFESNMTTDEALNYLVSLIRGIKDGKVTLRQGEETITLEPSKNMDVKVKASVKDAKEKVAFELAWRSDSDEELEIE